MGFYRAGGREEEAATLAEEEATAIEVTSGTGDDHFDAERGGAASASPRPATAWAFAPLDVEALAAELQGALDDAWLWRRGGDRRCGKLARQPMAASTAASDGLHVSVLRQVGDTALHYATLRYMT